MRSRVCDLIHPAKFNTIMRVYDSRQKFSDWLGTSVKKKG